MKPCSGCARHMRVDESICPFCQTLQRSAGAPMLVRFAMFTSLLGAIPIGCAGEPACEDGYIVTQDAKGNTVYTACGDDSIDDGMGEGGTYAGPDSSWGDDTLPMSDSGWTSTTSGGDAESSSSGGDTTEGGSSDETGCGSETAGCEASESSSSDESGSSDGTG